MLLEHPDVKVTGNMEASGAFEFDPEGLANLMEILSGLYTDPESAVAREYLTNAIDAQRLAEATIPGYVWRPVEVSTPGPLSPTLVIRDFGVGMDKDDLRNVYSKYGKSTKSGSNNFSGMWGIGSKSAISYSSHFTVTGWKHGIRTTAFISKCADDIPVFTIVDVRDSDDPTGVKIEVPVSSYASMKQKVLNFAIWHDGNVLVDDVLMDPSSEGWRRVSNDIYIRIPVSHYSRNRMLVMGGTPYNIGFHFASSVPVDVAVIAPIGSVSLPPNREHVKDTPKTQGYLMGIDLNPIKDFLRKDVLEAETLAQACSAYDNLYGDVLRYIGTQSMSHSGISLPVPKLPGKSFQAQSGGTNANVHTYNCISAGEVLSGQAALIKNPPARTLSTHQKKKLNKWCIDNGHTSGILITPRAKCHEAYDGLNKVEWAEVAKTKVPSAPRKNTLPRYEMWEMDVHPVMHERPTKKLMKGKRLVYVSPAELNKDTSTRLYINILFEFLGDKYIIAVLAKNRWDKFGRDYAKYNPQHVRGPLLNEARRLGKAIGSTHSSNSSLGALFGMLNESDIDDPELKDCIRSSHASRRDAREAHHRLRNILGRMNATIEVPGSASAEAILARYPLIDAVSGYRTSTVIQDVVLYLNAKYALDSSESSV